MYLLLRYMAMGTRLSYSESGTFGLFAVKNLFRLNALFWRPWLSGIPVRVLVMLLPAAVYFCSESWRLRLLVLSGSVLLLLPVSNLSPRPDLAVAAAPSVALAVALAVARFGKVRVFQVLLAIILVGMLLSSRDEMRILRSASVSLDKETDVMASILESLPGTGPVFLEGITEEHGGYGTFWSGEYGIALACAGYRPQRLVTSTQRAWEIMAASGGECMLVFAGGEEVHSYSVSPSMYIVIPDTVVHVRSSISADGLMRYPSCKAGSPAVIGLWNPLLADSVIRVEPVLLEGDWYFDLAARPVWLSCDPRTVILYSGDELTFSSRNISLENSADRHSQ